MKAPPVPVASRQAGGGAVVRLLTGENRPGFCKLSKSRIDRDKNGRECVGRLGASAGAGWGACWPGAVLGWPFGAGFGLYMTLTAKRQASGRKSSSFRPFSLRALLSLRMSSRSCWLCLFDLGGQAGSIGAAGGVSVWPWCWACRASSAAGGRAGRSRAVSVVRLPCWPCWGSLCGRWGWRWAWAAISGQAAC